MEVGFFNRQNWGIVNVIQMANASYIRFYLFVYRKHDVYGSKDDNRHVSLLSFFLILRENNNNKHTHSKNVCKLFLFYSRFQTDWTNFTHSDFIV